MSRIYNFSAGPAALPAAVLEQVRSEIPDWRHSGMSVMEVSHRGADFTEIAKEAERDLRQLMAIPDDYDVLFLQGGATLQFAMVPLNLARQDARADYALTGSWSKKAVAEGSRFCDVAVVADGSPGKFTDIPAFRDWELRSDAAYLHICSNETIAGVEFHELPDTGTVPIVADMSSTILSRPIDVSRYGLIYAGAQKNIGPAGLTLVIVRKDLVGIQRPGVPTLLTYEAFASSDSMTNTPPTFAWYVAGLVFKHLVAEGGLSAMAEINQRKSQKLYSAIDRSDFYSNPVREPFRSWMNVPFVLADPNLDKQFLSEADEAGLKNLKGHRSVGGMRASIYNAMPEEGIDALIEFMQAFESKHG